MIRNDPSLPLYWTFLPEVLNFKTFREANQSQASNQPSILKPPI